jgi:hypothetical protein
MQWRPLPPTLTPPRTAPPCPFLLPSSPCPPPRPIPHNPTITQPIPPWHSLPNPHPKTSSTLAIQRSRKFKASPSTLLAHTLLLPLPRANTLCAALYLLHPLAQNPSNIASSIAPIKSLWAVSAFLIKSTLGYGFCTAAALSVRRPPRSWQVFSSPPPSLAIASLRLPRIFSQGIFAQCRQQSHQQTMLRLSFVALSISVRAGVAVMLILASHIHAVLATPTTPQAHT